MNSKSTVWVGTEKSKLRKRIKVSVNGAPYWRLFIGENYVPWQEFVNTVGGPFRQYAQNMAQISFRQQAGISALKQELEVKTPYRAMNHPVIGVVTKADLASMEQISLVKSWLREAGAHNVLVTSAVNNNGVTELFALLHTEEGCC